MKYEATNPEGTIALLTANLQTIALTAFAQYEAQIEALSKALLEAQEKLKKYEPEKKKGKTDPEPKELNNKENTP